MSDRAARFSLALAAASWLAAAVCPVGASAAPGGPHVRPGSRVVVRTVPAVSFTAAPLSVGANASHIQFSPADVDARADGAAPIPVAEPVPAAQDETQGEAQATSVSAADAPDAPDAIDAEAFSRLRPQAQAANVRFAALRRLFGLQRTPETSGASAEPGIVGAQAKLDSAPAAPAPAHAAPSVPAPAQSWLSRTKRDNPGFFLLAGLTVVQVGVEAWGPTFGQTVKADYGIESYAMLITIAQVIRLGAGYVGGKVTDRIGEYKAYIVTLGVSALAAFAILQFWSMSMLPFAALAVLFSLRQLVDGMNSTSEQALASALYEGNEKGIQKFNADYKTLIEIVGIIVPLSLVFLTSWFGVAGTMSLLPLSAALAIGIFLLWLRTPKAVAAASPAGAAPAAAVVKPHDPVLLKLGMWGYPAFLLVNGLLYLILAIAYGGALFPGATEAAKAAATAVTGNLVAAFSVGGLLGASLLSGSAQQLWGRVGPKILRGAFAPVDAVFGALGRLGVAAEERLLRLARMAPTGPQDPQLPLKKTALWVGLGAVGLLGLVPFMWSNPLVAYLGMVPLGITNTIGIIKMRSMVQANLPAQRRGELIGRMSTATNLALAAAVLGIGQLFTRFGGDPIAAFGVVLAAFALVAAYTLWIAHGVRRHALSRSGA